MGTSIEPEQIQPLSSQYEPVHIQYSHWLEVSLCADECLPIVPGLKVDTFSTIIP